MTKLAVVVGCGRYAEGGPNQLRFPEADAQEFHKRLIDPSIGDCKKSDAALLLSPSHQLLRRHFYEVLMTAKPFDSVVLYYAGHGLRDETGQLFLAGSDTDVERFPISSVSTEELRSFLSRCRSKQICLILDCCYSGAFGKEGRGDVTSQEISEGVTRVAGGGTVILASSHSSQQSREKEEFGHGVFTKFLLEGLDGAADQNNDGVITPNELFDFASERIEQTGLSQRPLWSGKYEGRFILAKNPRLLEQKLEQLERNVGTLRSSKDHYQALALINDSAEAFLGTGLEQRLEVLKRTVEEEITSIHEAFRKQIIEAAGRGLLSGNVFIEAKNLLDRGPEVLFSESKDWNARYLRLCFRGEVTVVVLAGLWKLEAPMLPPSRLPPPPSGKRMTPDSPGKDADSIPPENPAAPPSRRRWWPTIAAMALVVVAVVTLYLIVSFERPVDRKNLRVGIYAKPSLKMADRAELQTGYREFIDKLNTRLRDSDLGFTSGSKGVMVYTDITKLIEALKRGTIDVAGEMSPPGIYAADAVGAEPFISPRYNGSSTYSSVLFVKRDSPLVVTQDEQPHRPATYQKVLQTVCEESDTGGAKIALQSDGSSSTGSALRPPKGSASGYWWPRKEILTHLPSGCVKAFDDITSWPKNDEFFRTVEEEEGDVVAGVIRKDLYDKECERPAGGPFQQCPLVYVKPFDDIPQGAFVLRKELCKASSSLRVLKEAWQDVAAVESKQLQKHKVLEDFPDVWAGVDRNQYGGLFADDNVFRFPDRIEERRSAWTRRALYVSAIILLVVSILAITAKNLKGNRTNAGGSGNATTAALSTGS